VHRQGVDSEDEHVTAQRDVLRWNRQAQAGQSAKQLGETDGHFHSGKLLAQALVHAVTKSQMRPACSGDVEAPRIVPVLRIAVGLGHGDQYCGAGRDLVPPNVTGSSATRVRPMCTIDR
jgi:hypothetical protein